MLIDEVSGQLMLKISTKERKNEETQIRVPGSGMPERSGSYR
jgi:hypothetical protein